jgi:hypothetical protein
MEKCPVGLPVFEAEGVQIGWKSLRSKNPSLNILKLPLVLELSQNSRSSGVGATSSGKWKPTKVRCLLSNILMAVNQSLNYRFPVGEKDKGLSIRSDNGCQMIRTLPIPNCEAGWCGFNREVVKYLDLELKRCVVQNDLGGSWRSGCSVVS